MLRIHDKHVNRPDYPELKLNYSKDSDETTLDAVDKMGNPIACLVKFTKRGTIAEPAAKQALESSHLDVSFAQWRENGAIIVD